MTTYLNALLMILMIQNDPHREETIYQNGRYRIIKVVGRSTSGSSNNSGKGRFKYKSFITSQTSRFILRFCLTDGAARIF